MSKKPVTPLGWEIKKRLAEQQIGQKEFCKQNGIPESRLSNIIMGTRKAGRYRKEIAKLLGIHEDTRKRKAE